MRYSGGNSAETRSQTISTLSIGDKECSVTDRRFPMPFLKQMILLSFQVTSIHCKIYELSFYTRWWLYTHLKKYVAELDLAIRRSFNEEALLLHKFC